jgi:hypothetical protein
MPIRNASEIEVQYEKKKEGERHFVKRDNNEYYPD